MCSYIISVVYTCRIIYIYHILFEGIYFVLSYSTHIGNAYAAGNALKIKKQKKMKQAYNKDKTRSIILKR